MKKNIRSILLVLVTLMAYNSVYPCTTFVLKKGNNLVFGRNLDWYSGTGLLMVNPRNLEKTALVNSTQRAIKWVSKFGSITFNQIGRELPFGGMNESGLIVEHMTLDNTTYPSPDNRYVISAFQWIQYQLDNFSTIEEVISSDTLLRIADESKIHFLICDRFGHAAVIEFLNGKMVCHQGTKLPIQALANSTYEESLYAYKYNMDITTNPSLQHFCTVARQRELAGSSNENSMVDDAFKSLNMVNQGLFTKWSIVYDITNMQIHFKVYETPTIVGVNKIFLKQPPYNPITKIVDMKGLDFSCSTGAKVIDLDCNHEKVVNQYLVNYSTALNKEFINKAFTFYKGWGLNIELKDEVMDYLAKYPETFKCTTL